MTVIAASASEQLETVSGFADLIAKHGETIVIISVFIVILLSLFVVIVKSNSKANEQILDQQKKMLDKLLAKGNENVQKVADMTEPKNEKNLIEIFVRLNDALKEEMRDLRRIIDADRVGIYVFHNGTHSSHGIPFFKLTCINERIKKGSGIAPNVANHASVPLTLFEGFITSLYKNSEVLNKKDPTTGIYSLPYSVLANESISTGLYIGIYDCDNNLLGYMAAEFKTIIDTDEEIKKIKDSIYVSVKRIAPILEYSDFQNTVKTD